MNVPAYLRSPSPFNMSQAVKDSASSSSSPMDWAQIIEGVAKGASSGLGNSASSADNKKTAREAKRRTLANLLNQSLTRQQNLFRTQQTESDELADFKNQALQNVANGFVRALHGSSIT